MESWFVCVIIVIVVFVFIVVVVIVTHARAHTLTYKQTHTQVLSELLSIKTPIVEADAIRGLACKVPA